MAIKAILTLILITCFAGCGSNSHTSFGSLSGRVMSQQNGALGNAAIQIDQIGPVLMTHTDEQGYFTFPNLPVGHFKLIITAEGYPQRNLVVNVTRGNSNTVDIVMES